MAKRALRLGIHIVVWLGVFLLISPAPFSLFELHMDLGLSNEQYMPFIAYGLILNAILMYVYAHRNLPRLAAHTQWNRFFWINTTFLGGFALVETILDSVYIYALNPSILIGDTTTLEACGFLGKILLFNLVITAFVLLVANAYGFTYTWFEEQKSRRRMEGEKLKAELAALKHQINPHFLFNVLNSLYGSALENDDEPTAEGIAKLSHMMRYMLYESNDESVSLQKELDYIQDYITLQRMRISKEVEVNYLIHGEPSGHSLPPMILQPFVENAFKYGISQIRPSKIDIQVDISTRHLSFTVRNTRHPVIQEESKHKGIGLKNVRKRLDLLCRHCYQLDVQDGDNYFTVQLDLDLPDPLESKLPHLFGDKLK
ncbi:MAG: sensor histidine kinase [Bacteroidia bacterium]